jgi:hypothetical protein
MVKCFIFVLLVAASAAISTFITPVGDERKQIVQENLPWRIHGDARRGPSISGMKLDNEGGRDGPE